MKKVEKYVFFGGAFGVALVAIALASSGETGSLTEAFYAQTEANAAALIVPQMYQQLSCEDITQDIAAVDLMMSGGTALAAENVAVSFGRLSGSGDWAKLKKRTVATSDTVSVTTSNPSVTRFAFASPVSASTLCQSPSDMVYLSVTALDGTTDSVLAHGSKSSTAYRGPLYNCVLESGSPCLGDVHDLAFTLRAHANSAPVITQTANRKVNELETLTIQLQATDPDGDAIVWGSPNLPEHATLDPNTGLFTFTPSSDQIGGYEVVFTATDDGGPVQQSSSIEVTITVIDVDTPGDVNQTAEEIVLSFELAKNVENSYMANLQSVDTFIEKGQHQAALNQVEAVEQKTKQDLKQETITQEQYNELAASLHKLKVLLAEE